MRCGISEWISIMSEKPNNTALYEAISDLIHYCSENELPRTEEMLIVCDLPP